MYTSMKEGNHFVYISLGASALSRWIISCPLSLSVLKDCKFPLQHSLKPTYHNEQISLRFNRTRNSAFTRLSWLINAICIFTSMYGYSSTNLPASNSSNMLGNSHCMFCFPYNQCIHPPSRETCHCRRKNFYLRNWSCCHDWQPE